MWWKEYIFHCYLKPIDGVIMILYNIKQHNIVISNIHIYMYILKNLNNITSQSDMKIVLTNEFVMNIIQLLFYTQQNSKLISSTNDFTKKYDHSRR